MISGKAERLFSPRSRITLITAALLILLVLVLFIRVTQADMLKIILIHAFCACLMFIAVVYKNYLSKYEISFFYFSLYSVFCTCTEFDNDE